MGMRCKQNRRGEGPDMEVAGYGINFRGGSRRKDCGCRQQDSSRTAVKVISSSPFLILSCFIPCLLPSLHHFAADRPLPPPSDLILIVNWQGNVVVGWCRVFYAASELFLLFPWPKCCNHLRPPAAADQPPPPATTGHPTRWQWVVQFIIRCCCSCLTWKQLISNPKM